MTRNYIILFLFTISFAAFAQDGADVKQERRPIRRAPRIERNLTEQNSNDKIPITIGNDVLSREQQLIFGLTVLNRRQNLFRNDGYTYYLRELLSVTGYSSEEAKAVFDNYKNNPQKYSSVLEEIKQKLAINNE